MTSSFPTSSSEFYALRDDRTNRCTEVRSYQDAACILYLSASHAERRSAQVTFLAAANLLSRWCRRVTLVAPRAALHPALGSGSANVVETALKQMRDADPFGSFHAHDSCLHSQHDIALCLGDHIPELPAARLGVCQRGWLASRHFPRKAVSNLAHRERELRRKRSLQRVSELHRSSRWLWVSPANVSCKTACSTYSVWTGTDARNAGPSPATRHRPFADGRSRLGGLLCRLLHANGWRHWRGHDRRQGRGRDSKFQIAPPFSAGKRSNSARARATAAHLATSGLRAIARPVWWNDYIKQQDRSTLPFDVWLPLANDFGVRLSMQSNVPPLMIHASTTANWGVNHGRHLPGTDDCLADRFPDEVSARDLACAAGETIVQGERIDAALPFCSLFAGLLVTAELLRLQLPNYPQVPNFALFDWYATLDTIQKWDKAPRPSCICRQQNRDFHHTFNKTTRHWSKFRF